MIKEYSAPPEQISPTYCDAFGELPTGGIVTRLIVAATTHANLLGIGYHDLIADGNVWVLSRMSVEMDRMPRMFEELLITTWIEDFGRMVSNRNFALTLADGTPLGFARSVWACINVASRRPADVGHPLNVNLDHLCPISPMLRLRPVSDPARVEPVSFTYSDIDLNGHVNSARYVERVMDLFDFEFHKNHAVARFDIAYQHEAHLDTRAEALIDADASRVDLVSDATPLCRVALKWKNRE